MGPQKGKSIKRRIKRSQSVIISNGDQKKLKRRNKKIKSIKSTKNGKNAKREIVKLENTKSGIKIAPSKRAKVSKKENQKPKNGINKQEKVKKRKKKKKKKS